MQAKATKSFWDASKSSHLIFPVVILGISFCLELFGQEARALFRYQANLFEQQQWWRLVSAHFTHLGWSHLGLNALGLIAIWSLFGRVYSNVTWLILFLLCSVAISLGFHFWDQNLRWYVGLSGVLHGLLMAAIVHTLYQTWLTSKSINLESSVLFLAVIIKLGYEQNVGAVPFTQQSSGGVVIVNAHLYGAVMGILCALFIIVLTQFRQNK